MRSPPSALLLATDLSARCDRALDRAAQLAAQWDARLVAATVAPDERAQEIRNDVLALPAWARRETPAAAARRRLRRDLDDAGLTGADAVVTRGAPGPALLQTARTRDCGLIVLGIARNEAFQRPVVGSTIAWLARHSPLPVLVVHDRVRGPYRNLAAASDFSTTAGRALETAARLFPDALRYALVHGADAPRLGLIDNERSRAALGAAATEETRAAAAAHLDGLDLADAVRGRIERVIEPAEPVRLLEAWAAADGTDLVVLGSHGRSALSDMLLGSVAQRLLDTVDVDALVVRRQA